MYVYHVRTYVYVYMCACSHLALFIFLGIDVDKPTVHKPALTSKTDVHSGCYPHGRLACIHTRTQKPVRVFVCIYIYTYTHTHIHTNLLLRKKLTHTRGVTHMVGWHAHTRTRTHTHTHTSSDVRMHIHTYMYTHKPALASRIDVHWRCYP